MYSLSLSVYLFLLVLDLEDDFRELVYRPSKRRVPALNNLASCSYDESVVSTILPKISEEASLYSVSQRGGGSSSGNGAIRSWNNNHHNEKSLLGTHVETE